MRAGGRETGRTKGGGGGGQRRVRREKVRMDAAMLEDR